MQHSLNPLHTQIPDVLIFSPGYLGGYFANISQEILLLAQYLQLRKLQHSGVRNKRFMKSGYTVHFDEPGSLTPFLKKSEARKTAGAE